MRVKKNNRSGEKHKSNIYDQCGTPNYALDPLLPYLLKSKTIWESACGEGLIVRRLQSLGFVVTGSDLLQGVDFFDWQPPRFDIQVTNPPFSTKYQWLERSYRIASPFALLMPVDTIGSGKAQRLFDKYGVEIIWMDKRINYKMPNLGYSGGGAHFASAWFTWRLGIGRENTYAKVVRYPDNQASFLEVVGWKK